ncbi:MAG: alpha/beta hydrolase [Candidatus Abyssobacteria bacterium SURF_5]|uniref:Alpha/beta hydrolase n=1 Tax=Abyssobacteria bacterium (strain SURF_5) TaxID=2093360 RepID=A0A3A4P337_ABYX5|nr:MAG: alpha/beta hydrolase [Candidatus Abyssubacteria bacterium SURF_5]
MQILGGKNMLKKFGIAVGILIGALVLLAAAGPLIARPLSETKLMELGVLAKDAAFVDVNGVRTHYVAKGQEDEPIIFIHGFSSSLYTWSACLDAIAQQHRVYSLDLEGFGFSEKPAIEYTVDRYADFMIGFMDALNIKSAVLCGNSMGGNISWRTALKYPDRVSKLILVDASGYPSKDSGKHKGLPFLLRLGRLPGVGERFGFFASRGQIRSSLESAYCEDSKVTDHTVDMYYYPLKTEGGMRAVLARMRGSSEDLKEWAAKIPSLTLPALIVWGENDTWIPAENAYNFHEDIAGSKLVILPGCGHLPQEEFPQEFARHVLEFHD